MSNVASVLDTLNRMLGPDIVDIRPLGEEGGMSRLFRGYKRSLEVDVVIKQMPMYFSDPAEVKREVRVMTSLRHQYLPRVYDFKTDGMGFCYTIMELIPGCTLRQYVYTHGALSQKQALTWTKQILEALSYMHSQHPAIVHSDLKPENIMITPDQSVCIIDFNASLEMKGDAVEAVGATVGYAAPEQYNLPLSRFTQGDALYQMAEAAQGMGKVSPKTDLYAVGALAYYMLTGFDPAPWNQEQIPLDRYDIVLNDSFRLTIQRAMERRSNKRFASAKEMLRALNDLVKTDRRYRAWRHRCQLAAFFVCAGILVSGFTLFWGWQTLQTETSAEYTSLIEQAQEAIAQSDYDNAQSLLFEAIRLEENRPEGYANLGALLYSIGQYQQAIDLLEPLDVDSMDGADASTVGEIAYVLGSCYYQLEDYESAMDAYQLATHFCPDTVAYQRDLVVCYAKLGYASRAQETLAVLSEIDSSEGDVAYVSGEIAYVSGDYTQALDLVCTAIENTEDHTILSRAIQEAAQCCQYLGDSYLDTEIRILGEARSRLTVSENAIHTQLLAQAWLRKAAQNVDDSQEAYAQALVYLEDLVNRGTASFTVRMNLATTLQALDRFTEAETVLLQLEVDYPYDYTVPMTLALMYADYQTSLPAEERDYTALLEAYSRAEALYASATEASPQMRQLAESGSRLAGD